MKKIGESRSRWRRRLRRLAFSGIVLIAGGVSFVFFGNGIARVFENDEPSRSVGTSLDGYLVNGKRLPTRGENFRAYGYLPAALGRNALHGRVRKVVLQAFKAVHGELPDVTFRYAECGWPGGGRLRPHLTHQAGLSFDLLVPVRDKDGPTVLKTHLWNRYGYDVAFDHSGWCAAQQCRIDVDAMAAYLHALADAVEAEGLKIRLVVFAPDLQPLLFAAARGGGLVDRIPFSKKQQWVRHDEHIHVEFMNPDEGEK